MADTPDTVVFGIHAVSRLLQLRPGQVQALHVLATRNDAAMRLLVETAEAARIAVQRASRQQLDTLSGNGRHQGVVAQVKAAGVLSENDLFILLEHKQQQQQNSLLLTLDGVQDPHNLGACLRSAEAAGADAVIVPRDRAVGLTPAARKVAAGSADFIPLAQVTNLSRTLETMADLGVWSYGAAAGEGTSLYDLDLKGGVNLVLGGESRGLRRLTRERCDGLFQIPMAGSTESLNVSVAAGICLFEALRQRRG